MATFEDPHDPAVESGPIFPPGLTLDVVARVVYGTILSLMLVGGKVSVKWKRPTRPTSVALELLGSFQQT